MKQKGLVHIYTGNGKGKTTAALGLGIRAWGRGFNIVMFQFLKGAETGEMKTIEKLGERFVLHRGKEVKKFTWCMNEDEKQQAMCEQQGIFMMVKDTVQNEDIDLLILDEMMAAVTTGMVPLEMVIEFIKNKPEKLEIVMTGRNAPPELVELADYVSEINVVKHPMEKGIPARIGIES